MDRNALKHSVHSYIVAEFLDDQNDEELRGDTPLISGGILDSIGLVKLVTEFESRLNVSLDSQDVSMDHCNSIDAFTDLLMRKMEGP